MSRLARWRGAALTFSAALMAALALIAVIMLSLDKAPLAAAQRFIEGAIGTPSARADVIMAALPMLLCAAGLLLTFTAGLWNIGVEGQVTMGAIFATIIARTIPRDVSDWGIFAALIVPAELLLAMFGGALWAGLAALLKIRGGINEIFGGVALNFISVNILLSLVNGAWRVGTFPQTAPFAPAALLPRHPELRLSPLGIGIALAAFIAVFMALRGTRFGLQLRAIGRNARSAGILGVRVERNIFWAMVACGALAGLAGAFQALFTRGRLLPNISGGIGFMGVLIVLLTGVRAAWVLPVALFLAVVPIGSLKLATSLDSAVQIDAALGNVFQGALVLAVLIGGGVRARLAARRKERSEHG
jgi:ABC-type uncharacterized transport system permease subunit